MLARVLDILRSLGIDHMVSGSPVQRLDVGHLVRDVEELDWPYVERWAATLGIAPLLAEVRA